MSESEYENLMGRGGADYSLGHRIMYEVPLKLMTGSRYHILEVGFGIGWGLGRMLAENIVETYTGCEPDPASFAYVEKKYGRDRRLTLMNEKFLPLTRFPAYQHVFCIEVIEHVPESERSDFLEGLRRAAEMGTLWLSTPSVEKSPHGVLSTERWMIELKRRFQNVTCHTEQWTTLYICHD